MLSTKTKIMPAVISTWVYRGVALELFTATERAAKRIASKRDVARLAINVYLPFLLIFCSFILHLPAQTAPHFMLFLFISMELVVTDTELSAMNAAASSGVMRMLFTTG